MAEQQDLVTDGQVLVATTFPESLLVMSEALSLQCEGEQPAH